MRQSTATPVPPGAHSVGALHSAGVSRGRLRSPRLARVATGLVVTPDSGLDLSVYRDRCLAVGRSLATGRFTSRRSAAAILRIPAPPPRHREVEVGVITPARAPRRSGLLGHRVRPDLLKFESRDGVAIPSPADVWCQLSAVLGFEALVVAGDAIVSGSRILSSGGQRTPELATLDQLRAAHGQHSRGTGTPLRSRALEAVRAGVDSPQESRLRLMLVGAGYPEPTVDCAVAVMIDGRHRELHVDLGYPELRIAIEYEGVHHFTDPRQVRLDLRRIEVLHEHGWRVIRVTAADLRDPSNLLSRIAKAFADALAR
ncbi:endonuclease domain-containing protein [Leucobacter musarum]|uniref:endonuclease domain-containing protein n=1 Tax=Leucobacter musarum TaxID=1930747 RepID=UPI000A3DFAD5|nr:hypothetical protein [Leucobacter musarum]